MKMKDLTVETSVSVSMSLDSEYEWSRSDMARCSEMTRRLSWAEILGCAGRWLIGVLQRVVLSGARGDTVGSLSVFRVPHPPFVRGILPWLLKGREQWQSPTPLLHATLGSPGALRTSYSSPQKQNIVYHVPGRCCSTDKAVFTLCS